MYGLHRTDTVFPGGVDDRSYYSDVSIAHKETLNGYNELIKQQKYQEASQYLYDNIESQNVNLDYNGSYVWNRADNQMVALENYAVGMDETHIRPHYGSTHPTETYVNETTWIV